MLVKPFTSKRPRVELVPLIDMFFLLLVFFIFGIFSMTIQQGLIVDLPMAATADSTSKEDVLTISVTAEGILFFNQQPATLATLPALLRQGGTIANRPLVVINADRQASHGAVMAVLDAVRQAGLSRVSFQTAPEHHA